VSVSTAGGNIYTLKRVAERVATKPYTWSKLTHAYG
jgi:hypothetical protein